MSIEEQVRGLEKFKEAVTKVFTLYPNRVNINVPHNDQWIYSSSPYWVGTKDFPLTAAAWTAATFSTTARTKIDLSAVFGVPANIKAILVKVTIRDSGSAGGDYLFNLTPNGGSGEIAFTARCSGLANDSYTTEAGVVPCDANGDVYYQIVASGVATMDVTLQVWGYYI